MKRFDAYTKEYARRTVEQYCSAEGQTFSHLVDQLSGDLAARLWRISASAIERIIIEKAAKAGMLLCLVSDRPEDKERAETFKKDLLGTLLTSGDEILRDRFPRLWALIELTVRQFTSALDEFRNRFDKDRALIEEHLFRGREIYRITGISTGMGDIHNHGRTAVIVSTDAGKFVYRPRDVKIDSWIRELFERFFPDISHLPQVLAFDGYGYSEFIENIPAGSSKDAEIFYYNYGAFCAVSYILGSEDLHLENVLSDGRCPVPVDLETMLTPHLSGSDLQAHRITDWQHSVLGKGLLSMNLNGVECGALFSTLENNRALPVIDGEKKNVCFFTGAFLKGFEDGYRRFLAQKEDILAFVRAMPSVKTRFLVRNTQLYANIVRWACSWNIVEADDLPEKVSQTCTIGFRKKDLNDLIAVADAETAALLEGNIPYFYTMSDSRDLYADGAMVCTAYVPDSCLANLLGSIETASEEDMAFQLTLLSRAFSRPLTHKAKSESTAAVNVESDTPADSDRLFSHTAEDIVTRLIDTAVMMPSGAPVWFTVDEKYANPMTPSSYGIDKGYSGISLFLDRYLGRFPNAAHKSQIETLQDQITEQTLRILSYPCDSAPVISEQNCSCGLKSGMAGVLLARGLMRAHLSRQEDPIRDICLRILFKTDFTYAKSTLDTGIAGLIAVLCGFDDLYRIDGVPALVEKLCDLLLSRRESLWNDTLLWKTGKDTEPVYAGFENGQCGIGFALSLAAKRTGRGDLTEAAAAAYTFVDAMYANDTKTWDAYDIRRAERKSTGNVIAAAGIGFAMLHDSSPLGVRNLERAISTCISAAPVYSDNLFGGNCSVIRFLTEAGKRLNRPDLLAAARGKLAAVVGRAKASGSFRCLKEGYDSLFEPAFLSGAAGIGYCALRCTEPEQEAQEP